MAQGYLIFHLNLAFSSIKTEARPEVISKCYWPLLELAEHTGIPIGIELTGWTLQQITLLDQSWVDRFRQMLENKQCELIGSGWTQIIGPLVPYEVNRWNQKLGLDAYQKILGITPKLALVNEMAFSTGMVDVYVEPGYQGIVMDRDNVRLALGLESAPLSATPSYALGCDGQSLPVLWSDSILFQRLQRVVHGDIPVAEYMAYVKQRNDRDGAVLPIYCNDAEIFDYRPGRFTAESRLHPEGEWERFKRVCTLLQKGLVLDWLSPSEALTIQAATAHPKIQRLTSASQPIPVKKQAKYNINRWAVSGRDNLWLNTYCHNVYRHLAGSDNTAAWQNLCEMWASDFRTHVTEKRWDALLAHIAASKPVPPEDITGPNRPFSGVPLGDYLAPHQEGDNLRIVCDKEQIYWSISTPSVAITINTRRGMVIQSLGFAKRAFRPIIGSLAQGYFPSIDLGVDFYSGGTIIELPQTRQRITDLEWVVPIIKDTPNAVEVYCEQQVQHILFQKRIKIFKHRSRVEITTRFSDSERFFGSVRSPILTFLTAEMKGKLWIRCNTGGPIDESFELIESFDQGQAVSSLATSSGSLGAPSGWVEVMDETGFGVRMEWPPERYAAMPMLTYRISGEKSLLRVQFSHCELDDTTRPGGRLPGDFTLTIIGL